jgi:hypothetical protein
MKTLIVLIALVSILSIHVSAQKVYVSQRGVITIDTTIVVSNLTKQELFNKLKKWAVINIQDYNSMSKGEVNPDLLKFLYITDYLAAFGGRQKYSQDVTVDISEGSILIKFDQLRTYVPVRGVPPVEQAPKGWSADKFFENNDHKLKPKYGSFYSDIQSQFIKMVVDMTAGVPK